MKSILHGLLVKIFLITMPFLILNQSIDEIEFLPFNNQSDFGNFNELNSAVEFIYEVVLGHKDQFPEYGQSGHRKQSSILKHSNVKIFQNIKIPLFQPVYTFTKQTFCLLDEHYSFLYAREITPPPNVLRLLSHTA